jgi:hypothetical protein
MAPLNIHPEESATKKRKNNKALKILLGIGALIAVPAIGSTLAAQITIGTGAIQFGQGVQQATACDSAITVTAASTFSNTATAGAFNMGRVVIDELLDECNTKRFTVTLYGDSSNDVLGSCVVTNLNGAGGATAVSDGDNTPCASGTVGVTFHSADVTNDNTLTVEFGDATTKIAASGVFKITVETA